ncbi:unnamed protein product [Sympodiomycopsis kandeliae]
MPSPISTQDPSPRSSNELEGAVDGVRLTPAELLPPATSESPVAPASQSVSKAKKDRRRQQVREAQARFRDRKDRTAEELRVRAVALSETIEKLQMENRELRRRLAQYEAPGGKSGMQPEFDGQTGIPPELDGKTTNSASWPGATPGHSPVAPRAAPPSGSHSTLWDQSNISALPEEHGAGFHPMYTSGQSQKSRGGSGLPSTLQQHSKSVPVRQVVEPHRTSNVPSSFPGPSNHPTRNEEDELMHLSSSPGPSVRTYANLPHNVAGKVYSNMENSSQPSSSSASQPLAWEPGQSYVAASLSEGMSNLSAQPTWRGHPQGFESQMQSQNHVSTASLPLAQARRQPNHPTGPPQSSEFGREDPPQHTQFSRFYPHEHGTTRWAPSNMEQQPIFGDVDQQWSSNHQTTHAQHHRSTGGMPGLAQSPNGAVEPRIYDVKSDRGYH